MKQELIDYEQFRDHEHCQKRFNNWREKYNCIRPHEAINFKTPAELYRPCNKHYPERIIPYGETMNENNSWENCEFVLSLTVVPLA